MDRLVVIQRKFLRKDTRRRSKKGTLINLDNNPRCRHHVNGFVKDCGSIPFILHQPSSQLTHSIADISVCVVARLDQLVSCHYSRPVYLSISQLPVYILLNVTDTPPPPTDEVRLSIVFSISSQLGGQPFISNQSDATRCDLLGSNALLNYRRLCAEIKHNTTQSSRLKGLR